VGGFSRQRSRHRPVRLRPGDLLQGASVSDIVRRGKQLAIIADDGHALGVQLGMTGHLGLIGPGGRAPEQHVHAVWRFDDGSRMYFEDARRFGSLRVFRSAADLDAHWSALGRDALTIEGDELAAALRDSDRPIKAALLDQAVLAGVGNIYADEALFMARIHPGRRAHRISVEEYQTLAAAIRSLLSKAVAAGGSTVRDYADADGRPGSFQLAHAVYGRAGLPCPSCSKSLRATLLAQRTTVWCPRCQPLRPARRPSDFIHVRTNLSTHNPERLELATLGRGSRRSGEQPESVSHNSI